MAATSTGASRSWLGWANVAVAAVAGAVANFSGILWAELEPATWWGPWAYVVFAWVTSALALAWWMPEAWRRGGLVTGAVASAAWFAYMRTFEFLPNTLGHFIAAVAFAAAALGGWTLDERILAPRAARIGRFLGRGACLTGIAAAVTSTFILVEWLSRRDDAQVWAVAIAAWGSLWLGLRTWTSRSALVPTLFAVTQAALAGLAAHLSMDPSIGLHGAAALAASATGAIAFAWSSSTRRRKGRETLT